MVKDKKSPSISIKNLSKKYSGSHTFALHDLNIKIYPGEVYGFLGPNGAGKSTTIRLLMNLIRPTSGSATILGKDIVKNSVEIKNSVGYLSGDMEMYAKMTGEKFLNYMNDLQPARSKAYIKELTRRLNATPNKKIGDLSRGNKQKIGIIQAFMHDPDILILDEPTSGLDPLMQEEFYKLIDESKNRGATIFISSHVLSEVQKMCDRIGIIRDGKLVAEKNIHELTKEASHTFEIYFDKKPPISELKKINNSLVVSDKDNKVTLTVSGDLAGLFKILAKHDVIKLNANHFDLEDTFLKFYTNEKSSEVKK